MRDLCVCPAPTGPITESWSVISFQRSGFNDSSHDQARRFSQDRKEKAKMNLNAASNKDLKVVAFFLATISIVALLATSNACAPPVYDGAVCGNGIVEGSEQCDPPDGTTCDESCQAITSDPPVCGNGIVEGSEQCDPPDGTTCDESCQTITSDPPVCGDGIIEGTEQCDPPDATTCDESCQTITPDPPVCGNGAMRPTRRHELR